MIRLLRILRQRPPEGFVLGDQVRIIGVRGVGTVISVDGARCTVSYGSRREIVEQWMIRRALKPSRHDRREK